MKPKSHKERIQLEMNASQILMVMSESNPGAVRVCAQLLHNKHDPDDAFGGFGPILGLDSHGLYGSNIWILFKDCCQESILGVVTALRACQLGIISESKLWEHVDNSRPIDLIQLHKSVKSRLTNFNPTNESLP